MKTMLKTVLATGSLVLVGALQSQAVISFNGSSYSQNFDTLASSPNPAIGTTAPWANDSTLLGWSLFGYAGTTVPTIIPAAGAGNTGSFYSFGSAGSGERALGGTGSGGAYFGSPVPASGAVAGYIAVALQNTSGSTFDSFTLAFAGEQWRNGGNTTAQTMALQYGFGGNTFGSVSTWNTPGGSFNYSSLVNTATAAAVDGNAAGKVTGKGGTISSLTWNNLDTLWIRWIENNDAGGDHGLAIDDFSIEAHKAVVVPEASTWFAGLGLSLGMLGSFVRKYRK